MSPEEIEALKQGPRFRSYATVVMHRIDVVGPDFQGDDSDTYAAGMTVLEQLKRRDTIN